MGCEDTSACGIEANSLPLLPGCPADSEYFLVMNATGGQGSGKYARRAWGDIKDCAGGGSGYAALSDTIVGDTDNYQNDDLIGASEIEFIIINKQLYTYEDGDFAVNYSTGTIAFLTVTLFAGDKICIPYSPA